MTNRQQVILSDLNTKPLPVSDDAKELKKRLEDVILPEIIEASEVAMISFTLDEYGTNYRLGTFIWDRLFTSLPRLLADSEDWIVSTKSNVLTLSTNVNGTAFTFYLPKVDAESRVPTGANSIKKTINKQNACFFRKRLKNKLERWLHY